jgi:5-methylcytosine-specific restriction endonuclease McrA
MDPHTRQLVVRRTADCCEYCRIAQSLIPFHTFHVEHIVARQHGGTNDLENLCLACDRCNAYKGTNLSASGRATVRLLKMNDRLRLALRAELIALGDLTIRETS